MEKIKGFMKKCGAGIANAWKNRNNLVNSVAGWSVYGGVLAVSVALALIFWL